MATGRVLDRVGWIDPGPAMRTGMGARLVGWVAGAVTGAALGPDVKWRRRGIGSGRGREAKRSDVMGWGRGRTSFRPPNGLHSLPIDDRFAVGRIFVSAFCLSTRRVSFRIFTEVGPYLFLGRFQEGRNSRTANAELGCDLAVRATGEIVSNGPGFAPCLDLAVKMAPKLFDGVFHQADGSAQFNRNMLDDGLGLAADDTSVRGSY